MSGRSGLYMNTFTLAICLRIKNKYVTSVRYFDPYCGHS